MQHCDKPGLLDSWLCHGNESLPLNFSQQTPCSQNLLPSRSMYWFFILARWTDPLTSAAGKFVLEIGTLDWTLISVNQAIVVGHSEGRLPGTLWLHSGEHFHSYREHSYQLPECNYIDSWRVTFSCLGALWLRFVTRLMCYFQIKGVTLPCSLLPGTRQGCSLRSEHSASLSPLPEWIFILKLCRVALAIWFIIRQ